MQVMSCYRSWRSVIAGFLLVILPSVAGAQLLAHARDGHVRTTAWSDHTSSQHRAHDHDICVQLQRAIQAPSTAAPNRLIEPVLVTGRVYPHSSSFAHQTPRHETQPRAPPVSS